LLTIFFAFVLIFEVDAFIPTLPCALGRNG